MKSPNVLVVSRDENDPIIAKVADFGLSRLASGSHSGREVYNPYWLAPEIMAEKEYDDKSDVYSFAIILWELLSRLHPFSEYDEQYKKAPMVKLEKDIVKGLRPTIPSDAPPYLSELILQCWRVEPSERPSFQQIVSLLCEEMGADPNSLEEARTDLLSRQFSTNFEVVQQTVLSSHSSKSSSLKVQCPQSLQVDLTVLKMVKCADKIFAGFSNGSVQASFLPFNSPEYFPTILSLKPFF